MVGLRNRGRGRNASKAAVPFWRTCRGCGETLPLDDAHFVVTHRLKCGRRRYRRECRICNSRQAREADKAMRLNPATREAYLAKRRAVNARYLAEHPDRREAYNRRHRESLTREAKDEANERKRARYARDRDAMRARAREDYARNRAKRRQQLRESYARRKADPERWAHYREMQRQWSLENRERINENRRMWVRLRAQRDGRPFRESSNTRKRRAADPYTGRMLPLNATIKDFLARLVERYELGEAGLMASVDPTTIARILKGEIDEIRFDTADRMCCALQFNLYEFWPDV